MEINSTLIIAVVFAFVIAFVFSMFGQGGGSVFSAYLTYLEPFVIKAVCIWCITSAIIITLLMLLSLPPAMKSLFGDIDMEDGSE